MELHNNTFTDTNFSLFNLNIRNLPQNYVNLQHFLESQNISFFFCAIIITCYLSIINMYITSKNIPTSGPLNVLLIPG